MGRIKVIHILTRLVVGGAQDTALATCAFADASRFDQALVVGPQTGLEGNLFAEARELGVRVILIPSVVREVSPLGDAKALGQIIKLLRKERPDIVHTHSSKAGVLGRIAARRARIPKVVHSVHGWSFHDHMTWPIRYGCITAERSMARMTDYFVVENRSDRQKGIDNGIGTADRYVTIRNGVRLERFNKQAVDDANLRRAVHIELGIPDNAVVVGSVIRLTAQKNPIGFVQAAAQVAATCPNVYFVIVGDGPLRDDTERHARELGLGGRLQVTGIRRDVPRLLAGFDVFALASRWEGLPIALLEAMASGVPVVVPRVDGIAEAIRDRTSGLLVTPDDPMDLAAGITLLIEDRKEAGRFGAAARSTVEEFFDSRRMVSQLQELYEGLDAERDNPALPREL